MRGTFEKSTPYQIEMKLKSAKRHEMLYRLYVELAVETRGSPTRE